MSEQPPVVDAVDVFEPMAAKAGLPSSGQQRARALAWFVVGWMAALAVQSNGAVPASYAAQPDLTVVPR